MNISWYDIALGLRHRDRNYMYKSYSFDTISDKFEILIAFFVCCVEFEWYIAKHIYL